MAYHKAVRWEPGAEPGPPRTTFMKAVQLKDWAESLGTMGGPAVRIAGGGRYLPARDCAYKAQDIIDLDGGDANVRIDVLDGSEGKIIVHGFDGKTRLVGKDEFIRLFKDDCTDDRVLEHAFLILLSLYRECVESKCHDEIDESRRFFPDLPEIPADKPYLGKYLGRIRTARARRWREWRRRSGTE